MSAAISAERADEPFFADLERRRLTQAQVEAAGMWFETNARDLWRFAGSGDLHSLFYSRRPRDGVRKR